MSITRMTAPRQTFVQQQAICTGAHSPDSRHASSEQLQLLGGGALQIGSEAGQASNSAQQPTLAGFRASLEQAMQGLPAIPASSAWQAPRPTKDFSTEAGDALPHTWPMPMPAGGFSWQNAARGEEQELPAEDTQQQSRPVRRGGRKRDNLSAKEKNREAQRRFRDRQREKVTVLEEELKEMRGFRHVAMSEERRLREDGAVLSRQIIGLQAEVSELHERQVAIAELAAEIAALKKDGVEGREAVLDEMALALGELQAGDAESHAEFCSAKLCLFVKPEDLSATDPALVLALRGGHGGGVAGATPGQLKLRLRTEDGDHVYSLSQLMHMPPQTFVAMYDGYVGALLALPDCTTPDADRLACELRALLCCFSAVHPRQSVLLQLRDGASAAIRSDAVNKALLSRLTSQLHLSLAQLQRMRQASLTFQRQESRLRGERQSVLHGIAVPTKQTAGASPGHAAAVLDAGARLRRNLDMDLFNACRLTTHFLTDVLTTQQFVHLLVASHPYPLNLRDLIFYMDCALPPRHAM